MNVFVSGHTLLKDLTGRSGGSLNRKCYFLSTSLRFGLTFLLAALAT